MIISGYTENPKELLHPQERRSFISTQPPLHHTFPPRFDRLLYVPLSSKENISLLLLLAPSILGGFRAASSESVSFRLFHVISSMVPRRAAKVAFLVHARRYFGSDLPSMAGPNWGLNNNLAVDGGPKIGFSTTIQRDFDQRRDQLGLRH